MEPATSVVVAFADSDSSARRTLVEVREAASAQEITLIAAAIVTLDSASGAVRLRVEPQTEGVGPDCERVMDNLFPASIVALDAVGRKADAAAEHYRSIGIESNLLRELGENLTPSGAALLVIVRERWLNHMTGMREPPGVIRLPLQPGAMALAAGPP